MRFLQAGKVPVSMRMLAGRVALTLMLAITMGVAHGGEKAAAGKSSSSNTGQSSFPNDQAMPTHDLLTWPRASADKFGCYMEKSLGYRDPRFNCGLKGYKNVGDPCENTKAYYEGPQFPERPGILQPLVMGVQLSWEQGRLQQFTITLMGRMTEKQARQVLNLPPPEIEDLPPNVMGIDVQYPSDVTTAVSVTTFDHMGAGDVECDDSAAD
jgi:hypothetical protein